MAYSTQDWAFGLQPINHIGGGAPVIRRFPLKQAIQATTPYQTAIYKGDIVEYNKTVGFIKKSGVTVLGATGDAIGVAAEYYAGSAVNTNWPDQNKYIGVWEASQHDFVIQSDGATTTSNAASYLHKNFLLTNVTAGNTNTGLSGAELDFSSGSITATDHPLKCIGIMPGPKNTKTGSTMNVIVKFVHGMAYEQAQTT